MFSKLHKCLSLAIVAGTVCYRIIQYAASKRAREQQNTHDTSADTSTNSSVATTKDKQTQIKKEYTCKRCYHKTDQPVINSGKIVCLACAQIIESEKAMEYLHGPVSERPNNRCCARSRQVFEDVFHILSFLPHLIPGLRYTENGGFTIISAPNRDGNSIYIYIDDKISLEFVSWIKHYNYNDNAEYHLFYEHLFKLLLNKVCAATAFGAYDSIDSDEFADLGLCSRSSLLDASKISPDANKTIASLLDEFDTAATVRCDFWDSSKSKVFNTLGEMQNITFDPLFTPVIKQYPGCVVDYRIMRCTQPHRGEALHKEAIRFVMQEIVKTIRTGCPKDAWFSINIAKSTLIGPSELLEEPNHNWIPDKPISSECIDSFDRIPYWYAFLDPPYGNLVETHKPCGNHPARYRNANTEDFRIVNNALFPKGTDSLEIYKWSTDWSTYFDAGHEWWGTGCWSIYDLLMERYIVIMASATD